MPGCPDRLSPNRTQASTRQAASLCRSRCRSRSDGYRQLPEQPADLPWSLRRSRGRTVLVNSGKVSAVRSAGDLRMHDHLAAGSHKPGMHEDLAERGLKLAISTVAHPADQLAAVAIGH